MTPDGLLTNLNQSQQAAVSSFADTLAILAGPGSGKTHTLTSRTAWLLAQGLQPWNVIVATFTVKAAREMKERIGKLIGNGTESKLILGTFHSIARRYLSRYGHLIGIKKDFGIADSADSLAILKRIIKRNEFMIEPKVARSRISGCKARQSGYATDSKEKKKPAPKSVDTQEFDACYAQYEEALQRSNLLDYDDLLLRCADLLRKHPSCVSNIEAVLIDEFQDTNLVQFDLMKLFAAQRKRITIVGDPDQSIYGWRAAEIKNYKRMLQLYPDTVTIALEANYRSSGAILLTALNVIEQDNSRVSKTLLATHTVGTRPVLRRLATARSEAEWIVSEIQRVKGLTGELLDLDDFAILLRSAALSRLIESELGKAGIAYRMVGGVRFYDRVEVKTILDYLRVISQPDNNDSLSRVINTPSRRIGETTIQNLLEEADAAKITLWSLILGIVQGTRRSKTRLSTQTDQGLSRFVNTILTAKNKVSKDAVKIPELIKTIVNKTDYENWLKDHHKDEHGARWANVEELINQATEYQDLISCGTEEDTLPQIDGLKQDDDLDHLSRFLATVTLASEVKKEDSEDQVAQVTISTIHAAKGLEWPVVFIPAAYQGSIPHSRSEDTNEERRIFYVAMTRAKAMLYMSCPTKNSQSEATTLSPFLVSPSLAPLLDQQGPSLGSNLVQAIALILRRNLPSVTSIAKSSALLKSLEDNLFSLDGEEDENARESRWSSGGGNPSFTMGQPGVKRRRIELGKSSSNLEEGSATDWKPAYTTTMGKASSFTSASMTFQSGFVSAGSHMQVLKEQSVNLVVNNVAEVAETSGKQSGKQKPKLLEGQGTLMGFLGKPEPKPPHPSTSKMKVMDCVKDLGEVSRSSFLAKSTNTLRKIETSFVPPSIEPALALHRVGMKTGTRPRQNKIVEEHYRDEYIFLSSSPPRAEHSEQLIPKKVEDLAAKPPLMPLIRPPLSAHQTTMSKLQTTNGAGKTYGVKRSMNEGWNSGSKPFKPPTMKRSQ